MAMKANYFKLGIFVIGGMVLIVTAVVALGAGLIGRQEIYFETYFDESVSGLAVGSPVELRGVRVGEVTAIGFLSDMNDIPAESEGQYRAGRYIRVVFAISPGHMAKMPIEEHVARWTDGVSHGLRVRLSSNLITGQAFLEGTYVDPRRYPEIEITWKPTYVYVPSIPSEFTTMKESIDKIFYRLEELDVEGLVKSMENLFGSLDRAVADARIDEISRAFRDAMTELQAKLDELQVEEISTAVQKVLTTVDRAIQDANVPAVSAEVQGLFSESRQTNEKLLHLLADPENQAWESSIPEAVGRLNRSLARIDRLVASEQPQVDLILVNILQISENLKDLTELLKAHPSGLLRSPAPKRSEALE
jgi:paraquat-inducible protein B